MVATFNRAGITFSYPDNWVEESEANENGWTVIIQSPGTAFLSLTVDESLPPMGELADAALDAFKAEYPDLESEPVCETIANRPAVGYDVDFFSLDLTNSCDIRSLSAGIGTILILSQATDSEEINWSVLKAIRTSLEIDDDE